MAHHCKFYRRFEIENDNELVIISRASWKNYSCDVYKFNITKNKAYYRENLQFVNLGGYLVDFPSEKIRYRYGSESYIVPLYDWKEAYDRFTGVEYGFREQSVEIVKEKILTVYPEMKYLIKKVDFENALYNDNKLINAMLMWFEHPSEVEALVSKNLYNIASNKNLYRLTPKKKKEIIRALNHFTHDESLVTVQNYIKSGLEFKEWQDYMRWNNWRSVGIYVDDVETYRYCKRKNIDKSKYHDMLTMADNQGHDITEDYWRYPNDPHAMHDRLLETKRELQRIEEERKKQAEKQYWNQLVKIAKRNKLDKGVDIGNGYTLFMPYEYEQWKRAADELNQCILACSYYRKMAKGQCLLLMIWHDGKPSSTCEIDFNKKILQHYGNEFNRNDCQPTEYEQEAIKQFLATFKPKKLKFEEVRV